MPPRARLQALPANPPLPEALGVWAWVTAPHLDTPNSLLRTCTLLPLTLTMVLPVPCPTWAALRVIIPWVTALAATFPALAVLSILVTVPDLAAPWVRFLLLPLTMATAVLSHRCLWVPAAVVPRLEEPAPAATQAFMVVPGPGP